MLRGATFYLLPTYPIMVLCCTLLCMRLILTRAGYTAQVFACTVGQKPSKAPFYVNDTAEVLSILGRLVAPAPASPRS